MSATLDNDRSLTFPNFTIVTASAGSGKTRALTLRLVQFLLSSRIRQNGLPNILAITFTNNAAQEMRQRVLSFLKRIALGEQEARETLGDLVDAPPDELRHAARALVDRIFDHYADFQVMTIDSFMAAVFRSSAIELGYPPNVEILLRGDTMIDEAFETISRDARHDSRAGAVLRASVALLDRTRGEGMTFLWDPYRHLAAEVKSLYGLLASHSSPPRLVDLNSERESLRGSLITHARRFLALLAESGLPPYRFLKNDLESAVSGRVEDAVRRSLKQRAVLKPGSDREEALHSRWKDTIDEALLQWNDLLRHYTLCTARMFYQPYLAAVGALGETLGRLKRQQGKVFIEDVNKLLDSYLTVEGVPDIYFRLGNRISHYLIDEFQDTSPIQWSNLHPLIGNTLAEPGGSLFIVGDTKQSIYSFRGADWQIMAQLMKENVFPSAHPVKHELSTNWRSRQRIVDFTREVFERIVPHTEYGPAAALSGLTHVEQAVRPDSDHDGYVEARLIDVEGKEDPERMQLVEILGDCVQRGFSWSDIAILTPNNADVVRVSGWLNDAGIDFLSYSSLDIRTRPVTGEVLALLRFLDSPIDDFSFASFILGDLFGAAVRDRGTSFSRDELRRFVFHEKRDRGPHPPLYKVFQQHFPAEWESFFAGLFGLVGYLPLYDIVAGIYKVFDLFSVAREDEGTLVKLLDVVKVFEEGGHNSIKDFLAFSLDEPSGWEMDVPQTKNAVKLMTIHKSKGLDFPVVIVLLYDARPRTDRYHVEDDGEGIHLLHITKASAAKVDSLQQILDRQTIRNQVDELNKLYVALTRAKEEMYVLGMFRKERKVPTCFLPPGRFDPGPKPAVARAKRPMAPELPTMHHCLSVALPAHSYQKIGLTETRRGEFIHAVLAGIEFLAEDLVGEIARAIGSVPREMQEPERILTTLRQFLEFPDVREQFRFMTGRKVLCEQEYVTRQGLLFRMDRVILDPDMVTVMDFKTGNETREEEYIRQVSFYMDVLREVTPSLPVHGMVAYVDRRKVTHLT
jgi:ATP-dependent exoDNAse (exonuclease V) beta subunit